MDRFYSDNKNIQMIISVLKEYNIRKVVVSPGSNSFNLIWSMQYDGHFKMYSEVDERNAAYMACGLAAESDEAVVIICTGATASRNYLSALTEAFYRKLPILAITGSQDLCFKGNLSPQYVDRSNLPADVVRYSIHLQAIKDSTDEWNCNLKINRAVSELFRDGGGPVHINLFTQYNADTFSVKELPDTRVILRYSRESIWPELPLNSKIAVVVGAHKHWTEDLTNAVDAFCSAVNAVVFVDHSSGYYGRYRVHATILSAQEMNNFDIFNTDLIIHVGEQHGDYYSHPCFCRTKEVWRVSEDGEMRDTYRKLAKVFEVSEQYFFSKYSGKMTDQSDSYLKECQKIISLAYNNIPELPFSNIYASRKISSLLPQNSIVHLGVSNTMRSWTFWDISSSVFTWANIGCRGIDGALPTAVGMSVSNKEKIHFCFLGDLTFFYGMNALGNREIGNNLRIMIINNGIGAEFKLYDNPAQKYLAEEADPYIAAAAHYGNKSKDLIKGYANALGFEYISACTKEEFDNAILKFVSVDANTKPVIFEVFTDADMESNALYQMRHIEILNEFLIKIPHKKLDSKPVMGMKRIVKKVIGGKNASQLKNLLSSDGVKQE